MQPGVLTGNLNSLGHYEECLNVREVTSRAGTFSGQYCLASVSLVDTEAKDVVAKIFREVTQDEEQINYGLGSLLSRGFRWSYCIPSSCTASDLKEPLQRYMGEISGVVVSVDDDDCSVQEEQPFTTPDWIFMVLFTLLLLATLLSTTYDYVKEYLKAKNHWKGSQEQIGEEISSAPPNPNPEASTSSGVEAARRPDTLDLPGTRSSDDARERVIQHVLKCLPQALESPVRDPSPSETDVLTSFSLISNGRHIFSFNESRLLLTSVDGIKVATLCWIILAHAFYVTETLPSVNYISMFKNWSEWPFVLILNTQLPVDTFLVCTGILISYNFFNDMNRRGIKQAGAHTINKKVYIPVFYFHRYIRLAPALAMMVLLQAGILHHMGSGPFWKAGSGHLSSVCRDTWWGTLLFVQNYINGDEMCLAHSWYAMVDLQLYLLSPVILFMFLYMKRFQAMLVAVVLVILGIASTMFVNLYFNLPAAVMHGGSARWHLKIKYEYVTAYTRLSPWIIGLVVGFLLHHYRSKERREPYSIVDIRMVVLGWISCLGCFAYSVFGLIPFVSVNPSYDVVLKSIYSSFSQTIWAVGVGWVIFACETGHGGLLHAALSQKLFQPLQRLTYCTYLVHLPLMTHRALLTSVPVHLNKTTGVSSFFGDLLFSLNLALVLCLLVELPFRRIFKTISINYGFALRFTEEHFITRKASDYNRMLETVHRLCSNYLTEEREGRTDLEPVVYSELAESDSVENPVANN